MSNGHFEQLEMAPHSREAEEALLGAVLVNPDAFYEVASFLGGEDFFILRNGWIWEAMERLSRRNEVIEYITLIEELRAQDRLEDVGGVAYITYLTSSATSSLHAGTYGQIVERLALRRRMLAASDSIADLARREDADINFVVAGAEETLFAVTERKFRRDIVPMRDAVSSYYDLVEQMYTNQQEVVGVPSGFRDLDHILSGFQRSDLIILAGRPGMGKTSLKLNAAVNAATLSDSRVAVFSLEMSNDQLVQRLISMEIDVSSQQLRMGRLKDNEWSRFIAAADRIAGLRIYLDDTPGLSILQLRTKCRRIHREHGLDLVIVDYLQLMSGGEAFRRSENRVQEISAVSRGLKELARELDVPIIAGAQLSRAVEQRVDKRPQLSDLRESGSIEQDADVVMFIYRDDVYNEASDRPNEADIIIAKHRNGPTGVATLYFNKQFTRFANIKRTDIDLTKI